MTCSAQISGEVYLRGVVGERFAVQSGARRGRGCRRSRREYMTGGRLSFWAAPALIFAAGMSGGVPAFTIPTVNCRPTSLGDGRTRDLDEADADWLHGTIQVHVDAPTAVGHGFWSDWSGTAAPLRQGDAA